MAEATASADAAEKDNPRAPATVLSAEFKPASGAREGVLEGEFPAEMKGRLSGILQEYGGHLHPSGPRDLTSTWPEEPERAIRAALKLREAFQAHFGQTGTRPMVTVGIGIETGPSSHDPASRPGVGAPEGLLRAAGLLSASAPDGGILLTHGAYRLVRGVFDVQPLDAFPREGGERVRVYLVERAKPKAFRIPTRGVEGIETRTVGRDAELATLKECYRSAAGESRTRVVLATGPAGVGKSRLLSEFQAWLELLPEGIFFFQGRATPETQRSPNGLFRGVFSFRFDIRESDSAEVARDKFRSGLAGLLPPGRADVVGQWLGFDFSGSESVAGLLGSRAFRQQALSDLVLVFRKLAEEPLVILLEDMHWADDGALVLLDHLAAEIPGGKLLVVGAGRPAFADRSKDLGGSGTAFVRMELNPLPPGDSRTLVEEILRKAEDVPEELRELIVCGAGGNPFFLEELIGLLVDRGVVKVGPERWSVDRKRLARLKVPDTLDGVLKARLRGLPTAERRMLQCASVVGRQFWDAALADLSGPSGTPGLAAAKVSGLLKTAKDRQLIFTEATSSFEDSREYLFKHDLLRDFVYGTVLGSVRRAYHAQVARWLEGNLKGRRTEYLIPIADHYEAAGEKGKAADYLVLAGRDLARGSLFREAIEASARALRLLPAGGAAVRAQVLQGMGEAHRQLGEYPEARDSLAEALALARSSGDVRTEILALSTLARTAMVQGAYAEAKPHLAEALALATRAGDREGAAQVLLNLADASFRLGDADAAFTSGRESLQIFGGLKDAQGIAGAHRVLGFAAMMRGDLDGAAQHHQEGLDIFEGIGDRWGVATCLINLGEVHRKMGKLQEAAGFWERSLPISRDIGARLSVAIAYVNTGGVLASMDRQEARARKSLKNALKEALGIGAVPIALEGLVSVALLHIREGDPLRSAKLLGSVVAHPSFNAEIQEYSDPLLKRIGTKTGAEALRTALDWGRARDFGSVVEEVIRDLEAGERG